MIENPKKHKKFNGYFRVLMDLTGKIDQSVMGT